MIKFHNFESEPISIDKITGLFKLSFKQEMDESYWRWRFENNPVSDEIFIAYATDQGKLVAYYAVSPVKIQNTHGKYVKIALSNMTMTHPDYQGKGLFKTLASKLFDQLKQKGVSGVFGFANSNSHYGFRKNLGWTDIAYLNLFTLTNEAFRGFLLKQSLPIDYSIHSTLKFDLSILQDLIRVEKDCIHSHIGASEYDWRFNKIPNNSYSYLEAKLNNRIIGHLVFKNYGNDLDLMEYWYGSNDVISKNELLPHLIHYLNQNYSGNIHFWSNLHSNEHLVLEKFGFQEKEFNSYFGFIPFEEDQDFLDIKNWHYRFTESDIF